MRPFCLLLMVCAAVLAQKPDSRHMFSYAGPLTTASGASAKDIAEQYLRSTSPSLGLSGTDLDTVYIARQYQSEHNGVTHLLFRQRFQNIEVSNAAFTVNIDREGRVINAGGTLFPQPAGTLGTDPATVVPSVRAAVESVNPQLAERYLPITSGVSGKSFRFTKGGFGEDIQAQPVWFGSGGTVQPAWSCTVVDADGIDSYNVIVNSQTHRVIAKIPLTYYQSAAPRGLVFERGSPQPATPPGVPVTSNPPFIPRTLQPFTGDPVASPRGWVADTETVGNNVVAGTNPLGVLCVTGIDTCSVRPLTVSAPNRDFSFPLESNSAAPPPTQFSNAVVVNLFYWVNRAHDLFYQIGFNEAAGNFQTDNLGRGGAGNDAVFAYAQSGVVAASRAALNNANFGGFRSSEDGSRPRMQMYVFTSDGYFTDSALDAEVIVHEYGHGVTNRLVPNFYTTFQGGAMGEAWSDFFALDFVSSEGAPATGVYPMGPYVTQNFLSGIRTRPYSSNFTYNPLTFAQFGHVASSPGVHADGEIWVQALVEVRAALVQQFGDAEGRRRMRRLAIDSLKLSPPAPSMIDARDAILLADRTTFDGQSQQQIWAAFARRGFGVLAQTANANSVHVSASFETPSNQGALSFYEDRYTIGEAIRIALYDANLTAPNAVVQLTSSSGDLESVALRRRGSAYYGEITTRYAPAFRGDGALTLTPGDFISGYYTDSDTGAGPRLVQKTVPTSPDYAQQLAVARPNQFPNETALGLQTAFGNVLRALPFEFPFYGRKYSAARVYSNGIITFDLPDFSPCSDINSLRQLTAIAPMWMNLVTNGFAQPNENVYISETPDSVTFRWAAETLADVSLPGLTAAPQPVNFSATLFRNGNIEFRYGAGNRSLVSGSQLTGCPAAAATVGISNGHESLAQIATTHDSQGSLENALTVIFQSPYTPIGGPQIVVESPAAGASIGSLVNGRGVVFDSEPDVFIRRVDVLIDGVARTPATLGQLRPDYCQGKDILGCPAIGFTFAVGTAVQGIGPGQHTFQLRATNSRGVIAVYPDQPATFTLDASVATQAFARLEAPADGAEISGRVPITGYFALPDARVAGVDVIIDGITYGIATYGLTRTDVCGTLPATVPDCPRIGFGFTLNSAAPNLGSDIFLSPGQHTLQLRGRDAAGRLFLFPDNPITIRVTNPVNQLPRAAITVPSVNETVTAAMSIMGYAYDPDGRVVSVRIAVDGVVYNSVQVDYGSPRPEVCAQLTEAAACPNIGFQTSFDTRRLSNGPHTLSVVVIDNLGAVIYSPSFPGMNFFVNNPQ